VRAAVSRVVRGSNHVCDRWIHPEGVVSRATPLTLHPPASRLAEVRWSTAERRVARRCARGTPAPAAVAPEAPAHPVTDGAFAARVEVAAAVARAPRGDDDRASPVGALQLAVAVGGIVPARAVGDAAADASRVEGLAHAARPRGARGSRGAATLADGQRPYADAVDADETRLARQPLAAAPAEGSRGRAAPRAPDERAALADGAKPPRPDARSARGLGRDAHHPGLVAGQALVAAGPRAGGPTVAH